MRNPRTPWALVALALSLASWPAAATSVQRTVFEPFTWSGNHAATIAAHPAQLGAFAATTHDCSVAQATDTSYATTVWWNPDVWDARGDTSFPATAPPATGYHVDIHKALSADPTDGREDNTVYAVGGNGSPGIAAMRTDFQAISSARLRNPMLISDAQPGVVTFYATAFLTTAHWWEIAITPTTVVAGGEQTAVPSPVDGLDGPFADSAGTPGPGHRPAVDSINVIGTGSTDRPCDVGWSDRFAVTRSIGGVTTDSFNPITDYSQLIQSDPSELEELYLWRIEFRPNRIDLLVDHDRDGTPEPLESFPVNVPWSEVYVHFISVTYQADHHPQEPCFLGTIREHVWRNLSVSPVKYDRTLVYPKESGTTNVPRDTGWMSYDLRDIQRFGPPVNGIAQANPVAFDTWQSLLACSMPAFYCPNPSPSLHLNVDIPAASLGDVRRAQLVYDTRSPLAAGMATLSVNGVAVGSMPLQNTVPGSADSEWAHRSLDIAPGLLHAGNNIVDVAMSGDVELDRLQIELAVNGAVNNALFSDGFESGGLGAWSAKLGG
ncbi:MAG TPA: hypothetical protein VGS57_12515 [Thermoanaerobaculia bacterium]|jgi:hypothetical protein|nr:hypothetical protein [Thermoanaerobaculia bacterium]